VALGFNLVPDRFGNMRGEFNVTASPDGTVVINLDIDPIFVTGTP
jgi:hypothetical protein